MEARALLAVPGSLAGLVERASPTIYSWQQGAAVSMLCGESQCLVGPTGAGKTMVPMTLAKIARELGKVMVVLQVTNALAQDQAARFRADRLPTLNLCGKAGAMDGGGA
ncbi:hypothetical protein D9Q98_001351 [Chlorella vulgaris]|uniref:Uncharacterized protein n=1 Tax=Chlorella vulgaris TaxID=3077 RepID=A0A9D4Z328_CHLVU|nr:hypothetical protein D9Q98_001351 [Chlorella vulgaris]